MEIRGGAGASACQAPGMSSRQLAGESACPTSGVARLPLGGSGFGVGQHQAEHQALHRIGGGIGVLESAEALLDVLSGRQQPSTDRNTMHGREREASQDSDCAGFPYHPTEKTTDGSGRLAACPNL